MLSDGSSLVDAYLQMFTGKCLLANVYWQMSTGKCLLTNVYWQIFSDNVSM